MIKKFLYYHGAAIARLIHYKPVVPVRLYLSSEGNSCYVLNDNIALYFKHSSNRMSPWSFTFSYEHRLEIEENKQLVDKLFLILICGDDGIACLSSKELDFLLDYGRKDVQWIRAVRRSGESYGLEGSNGGLPCKVADSAFPEKIFL